MEKKVCIKCKEEKELTEFYYRKDTNKFFNTCKLCKNKIKKEYYKNNKEKICVINKEYKENNKEKVIKWDKEYREKNKELIKVKKKEYYKNNKEKICVINKEYRENNKELINEKKLKYYYDNKESINEKQKLYYQNNIYKFKEYRENNREKNLKYLSNRRKSNPLYKFKTNFRIKLNRYFKRNGYTKESKTYIILGCTFEEFKLYIESQFKEWMNWDNYGLYNGEENYGWDLDHIIPLSSGKCEEDIIRLNHHSNIQPLCSYINRNVKRDKIIYDEI
jgi:hypothetical protein